ncbi:MAG: hypothetical protein R2912_05840 [Eubacteriales bacterium]
MKRIIILATILLFAAALSACAVKEAPEKDAQEPQATEAPAEQETPALSENITLPDGWTMDQAITSADVSALTGLSYSPFPEAASAAQNGKPAGGFVTENQKEKISFFAFTKDGQSQYDFFLEYISDGTKQDMPSDLWTQGCYGEFSDGSAAAIVLRGDCCMRVNFYPEGYDSMDKLALARSLAELFVYRLYSPR